MPKTTQPHTILQMNTQKSWKSERKVPLQGPQCWGEMAWLAFTLHCKRQNLHRLFSSPSLWHMQLLVSGMFLFLFFAVTETCTVQEPMSHMNASNDMDLIEFQLIKLSFEI